MPMPQRSGGRTVAAVVVSILALLIVSWAIANRFDEPKASDSGARTEATVIPPPSRGAPATPASDAQIANAARQYILESVGLPPNGKFINYDCPAADAGTADCWPPFVTDFTYRSGVLRVFVQVDRKSVEGKDIGDHAAHAIMNLMKLGSPPQIVRNNVTWVETVDGTGVHIAQYPL